MRYSEDAGEGAGKFEFMYFELPGMNPVCRFTHTIVASCPDLMTVRLEMRGMANTPTTTFARIHGSAGNAENGSSMPAFHQAASAAAATETEMVTTSYISGESGGEESDVSYDSDSMCGVERAV